MATKKFIRYIKINREKQTKYSPNWIIYRRISHCSNLVNFEHIHVDYKIRTKTYNLEYDPNRPFALNGNKRFTRNRDFVNIRKCKTWDDIRSAILNYDFPTKTFYCHYQIFHRIASNTVKINDKYQNFFILKKNKKGEYERHDFSLEINEEQGKYKIIDNTKPGKPPILSANVINKTLEYANSILLRRQEP